VSPAARTFRRLEDISIPSMGVPLKTVSGRSLRRYSSLDPGEMESSQCKPSHRISFRSRCPSLSILSGHSYKSPDCPEIRAFPQSVLREAAAKLRKAGDEHKHGKTKRAMRHDASHLISSQKCPIFIHMGGSSRSMRSSEVSSLKENFDALKAPSHRPHGSLERPEAPEQTQILPLRSANRQDDGLD
jgi:hypothetical protein